MRQKEIHGLGGFLHFGKSVDDTRDGRSEEAGWRERGVEKSGALRISHVGECEPQMSLRHTNGGHAFPQGLRGRFCSAKGKVRGAPQIRDWRGISSTLIPFAKFCHPVESAGRTWSEVQRLLGRRLNKRGRES